MVSVCSGFQHVCVRVWVSGCVCRICFAVKVTLRLPAVQLLPTVSHWFCFAFKGSCSHTQRAKVWTAFRLCACVCVYVCVCARVQIPRSQSFLFRQIQIFEITFPVCCPGDVCQKNRQGKKENEEKNFSSLSFFFNISYITSANLEQRYSEESSWIAALDSFLLDNVQNRSVAARRITDCADRVDVYETAHPLNPAGKKIFKAPHLSWRDPQIHTGYLVRGP